MVPTFSVSSGTVCCQRARAAITVQQSYLCLMGMNKWGAGEVCNVWNAGVSCAFRGFRTTALLCERNCVDRLHLQLLPVAFYVKACLVLRILLHTRARTHTHTHTQARVLGRTSLHSVTIVSSVWSSCWCRLSRCLPVILDFQCLKPLNTKRRLLYLKNQFVPRSKHFSSLL